jgi:hypothetical protein
LSENANSWQQSAHFMRVFFFPSLCHIKPNIMFQFPTLTVDKLMTFCGPPELLVSVSAPDPDSIGFCDGDISVTIKQEWKTEFTQFFWTFSIVLYSKKHD